jgi:hypothetical protein
MFGWRKRDALDWRLSSNDLSTSFQLFVHLIRISFTSVCPFSYMCYVFISRLFVHFLAGTTYFFHVCLSVFLHVLRISFTPVCPFSCRYYVFLSCLFVHLIPSISSSNSFLYVLAFQSFFCFQISISSNINFMPLFAKID